MQVMKDDAFGAAFNGMSAALMQQRQTVLFVLPGAAL